jgi:mono/diheme cytochrome c family protein
VILGLKYSAILSLFLFVLANAAHAGSVDKTKADEQAGALLFRDKGCAHCHGAGGVGTKKGPSLLDIQKDKTWTPAKMTDQILNGGAKMPPFADSLTDDEIAQLIAYVRARVKPVPPPAPPAN